MIIALAVLASATFSTADAAKKNKKKAAEAPVPVVLTTGNDSLSYAAGMQLTQGLMPYLLQMKMDTTYMADFIKGFKEYFEKAEDPQFAAYTLGQNVGGQLKDRMLPGIKGELEGTPNSLDEQMFINGFVAALQNDTTHYTFNAASTFFNGRMAANAEAKKAAARKAGEDFLAENKLKEGVITTASGLQYKVIEQGNGPVPTADQTVTVKYEGRLIDGTIFDSSYTRNPQTTDFKPTQVIKGWTEALTMMPVGSTWELYIPQELGYGERNAGKIPPFSTLIFKVELISVK